MNTMLKQAFDEVGSLPETDQQEMAEQIEEMITARKIVAAEADIAAGRVRPAEEVFDELAKRYSG